MKFLHEFTYEGGIWEQIHGLLRRTDRGRSADIILHYLTHVAALGLTHSN